MRAEPCLQPSLVIVGGCCDFPHISHLRHVDVRTLAQLRDLCIIRSVLGQLIHKIFQLAGISVQLLPVKAVLILLSVGIVILNDSFPSLLLLRLRRRNTLVLLLLKILLPVIRL